MPGDTDGELSAAEREKVLESAVRVTVPDTSGKKRETDSGD